MAHLAPHTYGVGAHAFDEPSPRLVEENQAGGARLAIEKRIRPGPFHDEFLAAGMIPVALTQREMIRT
jgi:hypothetical protein